MSTLPKSLHTVTAVTRVANFLAWERRDYKSAVELVCHSLAVLGYDPAQFAYDEFAYDDPTIERIYSECRKIVEYVARAKEAARQFSC